MLAKSPTQRRLQGNFDTLSDSVGVSCGIRTLSARAQTSPGKNSHRGFESQKMSLAKVGPSQPNVTPISAQSRPKAPPSQAKVGPESVLKRVQSWPKVDLSRPKGGQKSAQRLRRLGTKSA